VRILFVNHTSAWSGAEVMLMRLIEKLRGDHEVCVACPPDGPLAEAIARARIQHAKLPEVGISTRLHPLQTPLGLAQLGAAGGAVAQAIRRLKPDVIHANSLRAGLITAPATLVGSPPVVVRMHDRLALTPLGRGVRAIVTRSAAAVAAVSDYTARRFNQGLARPVATRVYNGIDHDRFDPRRVEPAPVRDQLGLSPDALLLGQVAQITPWKGQDTAIRALARMRREGLDAHLLLVGGVAFAGKAVRYDNRSFLHALGLLVDELGVRRAVHFLGQRDDVPELLRALDLSLLPSWDEPFGLVTVESMALGTPPLVSFTGAGPEVVQDKVSGRLLDPRRPEAWAQAAGELHADPAARELMGERARAVASGFSEDAHAREMLAVYAGALRHRRGSAAARKPNGVAAWPG
jgi:L-malate glycosyltransferase